MLFLGTGSPAKSLSTKTVNLSTCFCLRNITASFGLSHQTPRCTFQKTQSTSRGSLILWVKCFADFARSNLSWSKYESLMQADMYRVTSSFLRIGVRLPSNTNFSCGSSRGALTVCVFALNPDSPMSAACLKSSSMSKYYPI